MTAQRAAEQLHLELHDADVALKPDTDRLVIRYKSAPDAGALQWLTVRKHSDALLQFLLKGYRRRFGTERTEMTGADGAPIPQQILVVTGVPHTEINPEDIA